jgi:hypothetical protein
VTVSVSPLKTAREEAKSAAENNVPVVPPTVLLVVMKHPATVLVALMLNTAAEAEFVDEPAVEDAGENAGRVAFE